MAQQPYQRPARVYPEPLPVSDIVIVSPPPEPKMAKGMAMWLPLLFPVVGSLGSLMFVFIIHNLIWSILVGVFAGAMVLTSVLMFWQQRRSITIQRKESQEKYLDYLHRKELELSQIAKQQYSYYQTLYPTLVDHVENVQQHKRVWERLRQDPDFLNVSIGRGKLPLCCSIQLESVANPFIDIDKSLLAAAKEMIACHERVDECPAIIPLVSLRSLAIRAAEEAATGFMRAILAQIGMFYAPSDVRVAVCCQPDRMADWRWLQWLPHARQVAIGEQSIDAGVSLTCLFDDVEAFKAFAAKDIVPLLKQQQHATTDIETVERSFEPPHLVCFFDGIDAAVFFETFSELFATTTKRNQNAGATLIYTMDPGQTLPAWVKARVDIDDTGILCYEELQLGGRRIEHMNVETMRLEEVERIARKLAPLRIQVLGGIASAATTVSLQELLSEEEWTQDTIEEMWRPKGLENTLRVPIGRKMDGRPLIIDLKESADGGMGPHGMIVGATGSGKSELLRTIVTSLALHHSPEVLNFIFVDFKGGAAFAELANLPHRAGVVTNLERDVALIDRVYAALYGEVERRQHLLREAGNLDNIKHYQAMRKIHRHLQPMPYLLVIVDEFGELLANRPDFQELFVTIGRIGRSIGMHLLLATQRFDEGRAKGLESHLRYRICLRTFSAEESTSVLGSPQAFHLPPYPGTGYLKVDTNPLEAFKTASVSFPYEPLAERSLPDNRIFRLSDAGTFIPFVDESGVDCEGRTNLPTNPAQDTRSAMEVTELKHVVALLSSQPSECAHQVWLPPLRHNLTLEQMTPGLANYWLKSDSFSQKSRFDPLCIPIGQVDVPREQRMDVFTHHFVGAGGHLAVVGTPQSGKSTFLTTFLTSFICTHNPSDVQFYVIDLGGGLLRKFVDAPHVGAIYGKAESQLIPGAIRHVQSVLEEREMRFRDIGIDNMITYRALRRQGQLPGEEYGDVFLVIDDFGQLWTDFESVQQDLVDLIASGLNYGVHVVFTANRWADIRTKIRDNIGGRLELRLNDPADSEFGRSFQLGLATAPPGRAITRHGLYVQVALPVLADPAGDEGATLDIEAFIQQVRLNWKGPSAPSVRELPLVLMEQVFLAAVTGQKGFPIGVESMKLTPVLVDFNSADPHMIVLGDTECGKTNFLRYVIHQLTQRYSSDEAQLLVFDYRRALLDEVIGLPHLKAYACTVGMVNDAIQTMVETLADRVPSALDLAPGGLLQHERWSGPHYYLFVDDYDWMSAQGLSPLNPLVDLLLQARDIGLHVILTRRLGGVNNAMFEAVFKRLREMGVPMLVMGGDAQEAKLLGCPNVSALPPGRGYLLRRNTKATLIHTPLCGYPARVGAGGLSGANL